MNLQQHCGWYLKTAGAMVLAAGVAKMLGGPGGERIAGVPDPLFGLTPGQLLPAIGAFEVLIGLACFLRRFAVRLKLVLLGWLSTGLLTGLIGSWVLGPPQGGWWMGSLPGMLGLSHLAAHGVVTGVAAFLFAGSCLFLLLEWRAEGPAAPTKTRPDTPRS